MQLINTPGWVQAPPARLAHDVHRWTTHPHVSACFFTEVADPARAAELKVPGWDLTHKGGPGMGESAILTKIERWPHILEQTWFQLDQGGGKRRLANGIYAPCVVVEDSDGHQVIFTNAHLPAHIEGIWSRLPMRSRTKVNALLKTGGVVPPIRTWITSVRAWRVYVNRMRRRYPHAQVVVTGDFNVNYHRPWVAQLLARIWPELHVAATRQGDLGSRTIGFVLTTMAFREGEVIVATASDHKAGLYRLA
jgi:hypothetical protein